MAVSPVTFDLFAPEESVEYPTDSVVLHRNRKALYELSKVEEKLSRALDPDVAATLEEAANGFRDEVKKTDLLVELKGLPATVVQSIESSVPAPNIPRPSDSATVEELAVWEQQATEASDERMAAINMRIVEAMIVQISDSQGRVAGHPGERTREWFESLPAESRSKLLSKVRELSFSSLEIDVETESPGF